MRRLGKKIPPQSFAEVDTELKKKIIMNSIFDRSISLFDRVTSKQKIKDVTLGEFLLMGDQYKDLIEQIRNTADEKEQKRLKQQLPCATISAVFEGGRKTENLKELSGLLCLDIDAHDNPDLSYNTLMSMLKDMDIISYASRSVRGNGVFAIVELEYPEHITEQFEALEIAFKYMGIKLDTNCKDVTRLRFLSYDPEAWYRPDAVKWSGIWKPIRKEPTPHNNNSNAPSKPIARAREFTATDNTIERVEACVRELEYRGLRVDYADWVYGLGMPLASLGEAGRGFFHRLSQLDSQQYNASECDAKFSDFLKNTRSIGIGSFFDYCTHLGINGKDLIKNS